MTDTQLLLAMLIVLVLTSFGFLVWYSIMIISEIRELDAKVNRYNHIIDSRYNLGLKIDNLGMQIEMMEHSVNQASQYIGGWVNEARKNGVIK